ncbi:MAG: peptidylprolyl isomerase [Gammaproteobacteria bacterium]|nr:peptidylprolyl isomerase [Gammaproteobacteria bacterium]
MKNIPTLSLLMVLLSLSASAVHAAKIGVAATVNGTEILERKLQTAVNNYMREQGSDVGAIRLPENFQQVRSKVLDVLIGQELLWQAASRDKTIADDAEVDLAFERFQAQFEDETDLEINLQNGGYTQKTYYEDLRRRLSAQKWIDKFVTNGLEVSADEIHTFYVDNGEKFSRPEAIRARHILIKLESGASDEARENARSLLTDIGQEIKDGADFAALAKQKSQGPSAPRGGDLGYFGRGQMVAPFEAAAFALEPGQVSEIVETRFGLHLIQLVDRKPALRVEEKDVREKIRAYLMEQKYRQGIEDAVAKLKAEALIE